MKRHELWRMQYRERRYLQHVSVEELSTRYSQLMRNAWCVAEEGKLSIIAMDDGAERWWIKATHVLEEMALRGEPWRPDFLRREFIPEPSYPLEARTAYLGPRSAHKLGERLFKYGKECHLREMVAKGTVRVSAALSYKDPSLNPARLDDELTVSAMALPSEARITVVNRERGWKGWLVPDKHVEFRLQFPSNFYVYCSSLVHSHRLYDDFPDACVVIKEPKEFARRLKAAFEAAQPKAFVFGDSSVRYYDPFEVSKETLKKDAPPPLSKHFSYAYQREHRFIWLPQEPSMAQLLPLDLNLGPLGDICELLCLDPDKEARVKKVPAAREGSGA